MRKEKEKELESTVLNSDITSSFKVSPTEKLTSIFTSSSPTFLDIPP